MARARRRPWIIELGSQCVATYAGTSGEGSCLMDVVLVRLACGARGFARPRA